MYDQENKFTYKGYEVYMLTYLCKRCLCSNKFKEFYEIEDNIGDDLDI